MFNLFKSTTDTNDVSITQEMKKDAKAFIESILEKANFNSIVAINNDVNDVIYLMIEDEFETARIIGKDGQTLSSFQIILKSYMAKKYNQYVPLFVDCNEYFSVKVEKAQSKAKELEQKLSDDRESIELFPMTAIERRAIHTLYKDHKTITTYSIGEGDDRRIVLSRKSA